VALCENEVEEVDATRFLGVGGVFLQGVIDCEMDGGIDLVDLVRIIEKKEIICHCEVCSWVKCDCMALEGLQQIKG
jgi:hypothetical protein